MEFKAFDEKRIAKELDDLPRHDRAKLVAALEAFEDGEEAGWSVKLYGDGLKMITDSGRGQGRCLFFFEVDGDAVIVKIYKKETQDVPKAVLATALRRKKEYEQRGK